MNLNEVFYLNFLFKFLDLIVFFSGNIEILGEQRRLSINGKSIDKVSQLMINELIDNLHP